MCVIYKCRPLINFQKSKALQRKQGKAIDRRAQHTHKYIYIYIYIYIHAVSSGGGDGVEDLISINIPGV